MLYTVLFKDGTKVQFRWNEETVKAVMDGFARRIDIKTLRSTTEWSIDSASVAAIYRTER